ncbi:ATP synthase F(1) complex subunit epsilon, mitochondrial-like [Saccoglossus kowalevskii]
MVAAWRQAGMSYIQYSSLCARLLRRALKPDAQAKAMKKEETFSKVNVWKDGKPEKKD